MADAAGLRFGIQSREDLLALKIATTTIDHWRSVGRLHVVHEGVYAVGHPYLSSDARALAAVLACGPTAALSHVSCAYRRRLLEFDDAFAVHVTIAGRSGREKPRISIHRPRCFDPDRDVEVVDGIRMTTVERTLMDLAAVVSYTTLKSAIRQAEFRQLIGRDELLAIEAMMGARRGRRNFRLAIGATSGRTRSQYEERFRRLCRRIGMPPFEVNVVIDGAERDFFFPSLGLIVEIDPAPTHDLAVNLESDPQRDIAALAGSGHPTVRFTGCRLDWDLEGIADDMRALARSLSRGGWADRGGA